MMHSLVVCVRGYKRYFRRVHLDSSRFLKDDCLKIYCTFGVVVSSPDFPRLNPIQVPQSDMEAHFGTLLENEDYSDVTFLVAGEKFHAHKIVLAARSATFRSEFFNGNVEKNEANREIVVPDIEPKVFKAVLHFIYRDTLVEDEELLKSRSEFLSFESFPAKLLAAAEKYSLPRLKLMCESELCKHISIDTVAYMMALADRCRATELKSICLRFCAENDVDVPLQEKKEGLTQPLGIELDNDSALETGSNVVGGENRHHSHSAEPRGLINAQPKTYTQFL